LTFVTNVYECKSCGYRWHNPLSGTPEQCPRCKLIKEIVFKAEKGQVPFSGYRLFKNGRGIEFKTPNGWIEILIEENNRLFIKNEYNSLVRPINTTELEQEFWTELKAIQAHVTEEARKRGEPIIEMKILPDGITSDDLEETRPNRAERRRRLRN
jgi:hypothetical protein